MLHNSYTLNYTKFKKSMQLDNFPKYIPISPGLWVHFTTNSDCNKFVQKGIFGGVFRTFPGRLPKIPGTKRAGAEI